MLAATDDYDPDIESGQLEKTGGVSVIYVSCELPDEYNGRWTMPPLAGVPEDEDVRASVWNGSMYISGEDDQKELILEYDTGIERSRS